MMNSVVKMSGGAAACAEELIILRAEAIERMGDEEIYREIAHYFAGHLEESLRDLGEALDRADTESAGRFAHSMKGNCATVGAEAMRENCLTLEQLCRSGALEAARAQYAGMAPKMLALREVLLAL